MISKPTELQLKETLIAAGNTHHDYQANFLNGVNDEYWAGWYAAYTLGRLGEFTTPTTLTRWLEGVSGDGDWSMNAASYVQSVIEAS